MTALGKAKMEEWKNNQQQVVVCSQSGERQVGKIIDYDDTEIVLEKGIDFTTVIEITGLKESVVRKIANKVKNVKK